jgi:hypothetical protein
MKKLTRREIVEANILYAKLDTPEERRQLADFHMGRDSAVSGEALDAPSPRLP